MPENFLPVSIVCEVGEAAYIIDNNGEKPCIFRYSFVNDSTSFLGRIERADPLTPKMSFIDAFYYDEKIYFIPKFLREINYIVIYNIRSNELSYKEIDDKNFVPFRGYESFSIIGNSLWLFPADMECDVSVLSLDSLELSLVKEWGLAARKAQKEVGRPVKSGDTILIDGVMYTPLADSDAIVAMSTKDRSTHIYYLGDRSRLTFVIAHDGNNFWVSRRKNEGLVCWNPSDGVIAEIPMASYSNIRSTDYHGWFQKMFCCCGSIWVFPKNDNVLLKIDTDTGNINRIPFHDREDDESLTNRQYYIIENNGSVRVYPQYGTWLAEVDLNDNGRCKNLQTLHMPSEWQWSPAMRDIYSGAHRRGKIIQEDSPYVLEKFICGFSPSIK